jgi:hypothetical protein
VGEPVKNTGADLAAVELDQSKLLGFRHIAVFEADPMLLTRALNAAHNKIGGEEVPSANPDAKP